MMNRDLMARQMFAKGGAAFPDLSGDGKVTKKDILMGRGVVPMQEGGVPPVDPEVAPMYLTDEERRMREEAYIQQEANRLIEKGIQEGQIKQEEVDRSFMQRLLDSIKGRPAFSSGDPDGGSVQEYAYGGQVNYMQEGGMAPVNPMVGMPVPQDAAMPPMAQAAGVDPAIMEQMLMQASQGITSLDEAQTSEEVMNAMRGDEATVEERRMELASVVGDQDAQQTPESVLTLVQPVMMMAQVDQGIGGLAQEQMGQPVSGDMAQGIMSTVDMGAEEGPAPVNFKYGGVVGMQAGGNPLAAPPVDVLGPPQAADPLTLDNIYTERKKYYTDIFGDPSAGLQKQKELNQAQTLFDLAKVGLAIASKPPVSMSPAEKLAYSLQSIDFFGRLGQRSQDQLQREQDVKRQGQQIQLAALQSAEEEMGREAERQFKAGERVLDRALELTKQSNQLKFNREERLDAQGFQQKLQDESNDLQRTMQALKGDQSKESIRLQGEMSQRLAELNSELRINENQLQFENRLEEIGVLNLNELSRMEKGQEFNLELKKYQSELAEESNRNQRTWQAAQNALNMLHDRNMAFDEREFRKLMQEDLQEFEGDQRNIDREINKAQTAVENGFKERGLDLQSERLDMDAAAMVLDDEYKKATLRLEEEARLAEKLDKTSGVIEYITDKDRLDKYANDKLGDETAKFEQTILNYAREPDYQWNGKEYAPTVPQLAPAILAAMDARRKAGLSVPAIEYAQDGVIRPLEEGEQAAFDSVQFSQNLYTPETGVNFDSPDWDRVPTYLSDTSDLSFTDATGLRSLGSRISGWFKEKLREPLGTEGLTKEQRNNLMVDKVFEQLRINVEQATLSGYDDRVLKGQVERIDKALKDLAGGAFNTDEAALATLSAVRRSLSQLFANSARIDPKYNPRAAREYKADTIQKYRKMAQDIRDPLADVIRLEKAYQTYIDSLSLTEGPGSFNMQKSRDRLSGLKSNAAD